MPRNEVGRLRVRLSSMSKKLIETEAENKKLKGMINHPGVGTSGEDLLTKISEQEADIAELEVQLTEATIQLESQRYE